MGRGSEVQKRATPPPGRGSDYELLRLVKELDWLRTLAHVSPVAIVRVDARGRCTYVNERWSELTGRNAQTAVGETWEVGIHPEDVPRLREEWRRAVEDKRPMRLEYRYLQPTGRCVWLLAQVVREVDGHGRTKGYVGTFTDITELHQIRVELQRSHAALELRMRDRVAELQRMALIVENLDDAVVGSNYAGKITTWNRGAEKIFGYTAVEMIGQSSLVLTPEGKQEEARDIKQRARAGEEIHHFETIRIAKSGEPIEVSLSVVPLREAGGSVTGTFGIVRDITPHKRAERRLQNLSWRLLRIQDDERRRLARELHDSTAQAVAALAMNLTVLARTETPLPEERRRQLLLDSLQLAEQATSELRTTAYLLHPPLLEENGLPSALRWLAEGFAQRSGLAVALNIAPQIARQSPDVETALFRVAQESLHNVHRHAESPSVEIHLRMDGPALVLEVRDRGRGFAGESSEAPGVGIAGMRERLLQFGGTLLIEPNHPGTAVIARLPVP
jgi:PAS domain S-box-containing protein